ncbi:MAG: hypothetical protein EOP87_14460 [Verrucomicrobiaceae bacterium]|nr:MAG: hypothetical protein EOP87_14460 [Verrucomicrobiaceae bacterium]
MIVAVAWKGGGILVLPIILIPLLISLVFTSDLVVPGQDSYPHMWPQGVSLLVSAVVLFLVNRHLRQGPRSPDRPAVSGEYTKYARKLTIEAEKSKLRSTSRFSAENNTGWFMFIPTGIWPLIIGAIGVFLITGDVLKSVTRPVNSEINRPAR